MTAKTQNAWTRTAIVCGMLLAGVVLAAPRTVYVDSSVAGPGTGTAGDPYDTIGSAVADLGADAGVGENEGTVLIAGGSYASTLNGGKENFGTEGVTITKYMTVKGGYAGSGDWTETSRVPRTTDIDLTGAGTRAFYQSTLTHQTRASTFDGLTIRNANHGLVGGAIGSAGGWAVGMAINDCLFEGNTTSASGGAVDLLGTAAGTAIRNSDFVNNSSGALGGAVYWRPSYSNTHEIENCTFQGNSAATGGAVFASPGSNSSAAPVITGCTFAGNSATSKGGAVYSSDGEGTVPVAIKQTRLTGNSAPQGAAVGGSDYWHGEYYLENCLVTGNLGGYALMANGWRVNNDYALDIAFCTIADNPGGGIYANQAYPSGDLGLRVRSSIIASNGDFGIYYNANGDEAPVIEYNDVWNQTTDYLTDAVAGTGSVSMDPLFRGSGDDPYMLKTASPVLEIAADLGLAMDLMDCARPSGPGFAMGAFEVPIPEPGTAVVLALAALVVCRRRR